MYKMQAGKFYHGRITINPKPGVKTGLGFIRAWFKTKFHGDEKVTVLGADTPPWQSNTLREPVSGTVPLAAMVQESDPRGATVWFSGQWVGTETDPAKIQKDYNPNEVYVIHDMIETESGNWVIKDGAIQEVVGGFGSGGGYVIVDEAKTEASPAEVAPQLKKPGATFETRLVEGKLYEGTIRAITNNVSVDDALQSLGFYETNVNQKLAKGQTANFEGQWKRSTGNYNLRTAQYQVVSLQSVALDRGKGKPTQKEAETWQPSERMSPLRPEFEDTGYRREYEEGMTTQDNEPGDSNTALWVLGILGVSVAGYIALKGTK